MTRLPVTAAGHIALEEELRHRIRVARPSLVRRIQQAISDEANLVENSEYQAALAEQELNHGWRAVDRASHGLDQLSPRTGRNRAAITG
jgi:Transcription elongation factor, N-terminal